MTNNYTLEQITAHNALSEEGLYLYAMYPDKD